MATIKILNGEIVSEENYDLKRGITNRLTITNTGIDVNGNIVVSGNVDGVNVSELKNDFDSHEGSTNNPHSVTKSQVGLGSVENYGIATLSEAEAGTSNEKYMTPLRVRNHGDNRYLQGNETITLTGDVTGSGATSITTTVTEGAVTQHEGAIDHNALSNYVSQEHFRWDLNVTGEVIHVDNIPSNIPFTRLTEYTISGKDLGQSLDGLSAGIGLSFTTGSTYDGSTPITINSIPASDTQVGHVTIGAQTFAGNKTFTGDISIQGDLEVLGDQVIFDTETVQTESTYILINRNGGDVSANESGIRIERASTDGSLIFDSNASSNWKLGLLGSEIEIVDISSSQTLTNKTIDGLQLVDDSVPNSKLANSTISNVELGDNLFDLTAGSGLEFATGSFYDGSDDRIIRIAEDGVTNAMILNSSLSVTTGTGLTGGGSISLGGTREISFDESYGDGRYGRLGSDNTWGGVNTFDSIIDNNTNFGKRTSNLPYEALDADVLTTVGEFRFVRPASSGSTNFPTRRRTYYFGAGGGDTSLGDRGVQLSWDDLTGYWWRNRDTDIWHKVFHSGEDAVSNHSAQFDLGYNVGSTTVIDSSRNLLNIANLSTGLDYSGDNIVTVPASTSQAGHVTTGSQSFAGDKTFTGDIYTDRIRSLSLTDGNTQVINPSGDTIFIGNTSLSRLFLQGSEIRSDNGYNVGTTTVIDSNRNASFANGTFEGEVNAESVEISSGGAYLKDGHNVITIATKGDATNYTSTIAGRRAGDSVTDGSTSRQSAFGYEAGRENTGDLQSAFGFFAGRGNTGDRQSAFGYFAGYENTGERQSAFGYLAGYQNTGDNGVFIGHEAGRGNELDNQFIVEQRNVNATPLIQGDFSTGNVSIVSLDVATTADFGGLLQHPDYAQSGMFGDYWGLDPEVTNEGSFLEIDNIRVRNSLKTHIFKKDIVKASNGLLYISDAGEIMEQVVTSSTFNIKVDQAVFSVGDIVEYKDSDDITGTINYVKGKILSYIGESTIEDKSVYEYSVELIQGSGVTLKAGDTIVRTSGGTILLDASSEYAPFIDVMQDGDMKARLGNLARSAGHITESYLEYEHNVEEDDGEIVDKSATREWFASQEDTDIYGAYLEDQVVIQLGDSNEMLLGKHAGGIGKHGIKINRHNFQYGDGEWRVGDSEHYLYHDGIGNVTARLDSFDLEAGAMVINSDTGIEIDATNYFKQDKTFSFGGGLLEGTGTTLSISGNNSNVSIDIDDFTLISNQLSLQSGTNASLEVGNMVFGLNVGGVDVHGIEVGVDYWYDNNTFQFGGTDGISYDGGRVSVGSNTDIFGTLRVGAKGFGQGAHVEAENPMEPLTGGGYHNNGISQYLNVSKTIHLGSAKIYANDISERSISIYKGTGTSGELIYSDSFEAVSGENIYTFDIILSEGDYTIRYGSASGSGWWRNSSSNLKSYPVNSGSFSWTGTSAGDTYFYYTYDLEISGIGVEGFLEGSTTITGNQITTGILKSNNDNLIFDLDNGKLTADNFTLDAGSGSSKVLLSNSTVNGEYFNIGNKLTWDGSILDIDGSGSFSGDVTALNFTAENSFELKGDSGDEWLSTGEFQFGGSNGINHDPTRNSSGEYPIHIGSSTKFFGDVDVTSLPRVSDEGLVGHWRLDESGSESVDVAGNNNADISNVTRTSGVTRGGVAFDGTSASGVPIGGSGDYLADQSDNFIMSVYVFIEDLVDTGGAINRCRIFAKSDMGSGYGIVANVSNLEVTSIVFGARQQGGGRISTATSDFDKNRYIHIIGHYTPDRLYLYIDGKLKNDGNNTLTEINNSSDPLSLGGRGGIDGSVGNFKGKIDAPFYYDVSGYTEKEVKDLIKSLYTNPSGNSGGLISTENLVVTSDALINNLLADSATISNTLTIGEGGSGGEIVSSNYSDTEGSEAGYKILPKKAIFNDVTIRGTLDGTEGSFSGDLTGEDMELSGLLDAGGVELGRNIQELGTDYRGLSYNSLNFWIYNSVSGDIVFNVGGGAGIDYRSSRTSYPLRIGANAEFAGSLSAASGTFEGNISFGNFVIGVDVQPVFTTGFKGVTFDNSVTSSPADIPNAWLEYEGQTWFNVGNTGTAQYPKGIRYNSGGDFIIGDDVEFAGDLTGDSMELTGSLSVGTNTLSNTGVTFNQGKIGNWDILGGEISSTSSSGRVQLNSSTRSFSVDKTIDSTNYNTIQIRDQDSFDSGAGNVLDEISLSVEQLIAGSASSLDTEVQTTTTISPSPHSDTGYVEIDIHSWTGDPVLSYNELEFKLEVEIDSSWVLIAGTPFYVDTDPANFRNNDVRMYQRIRVERDEERILWTVPISNVNSIARVRVTHLAGRVQSSTDKQIISRRMIYRQTLPKTSITHRGYENYVGENYNIRHGADLVSYNNVDINYNGSSIFSKDVVLSYTGSFFLNNKFYDFATLGDQIHYGDIDILGSFSAETKDFKINHPDPKMANKFTLHHRTVEAPTSGETLYSYTHDINDQIVLDVPDYYWHLNSNPRVFIQNRDGFGMGKWIQEGKKITIIVNEPGVYDILLMGTRKDVSALESWEGAERELS